MFYRDKRPARCICHDRQGRAPGRINTQAPALYPQAAHRQQTGCQPEKGGGQNQEKRIGGMRNDALYRGGRKSDLYVSQRRPAQDDGQDYRRPAGYGREYAGAGPADPFQTGTNDGFRL